MLTFLLILAAVILFTLRKWVTAAFLAVVAALVLAIVAVFVGVINGAVGSASFVHRLVMRWPRTVGVTFGLLVSGVIIWLTA